MRSLKNSITTAPFRASPSRAIPRLSKVTTRTPSSSTASKIKGNASENLNPETHPLGNALRPGSLLFAVEFEVHVETGGWLVDGISEPFFLPRGDRHAHVKRNDALGDATFPIDAGREAFGKDALDDRRPSPRVCWEVTEFLHPKDARFFIITIHH